jgi:hypothetical protein
MATVQASELKSQTERRADEGVGLHAAGEAAGQVFGFSTRRRRKTPRKWRARESMNRSSGGGTGQKTGIPFLNEIFRMAGVRKCF